MHLNAPELMQPVFNFLDGLIRDYGDILFMLLVYATIPLIAWILSGGLRRRTHGQSHITVAPFFMIRPPAPPPPDLPPIIGDDPERGRWDCNDD
jgi:hypothetical protein